MVTGTLLSTSFLVGGAQNSVQVGMDRLGADILILPQDYVIKGQSVLLTGKPTTFAFQDSVLSRVKSIPGIAVASPQLYIGTLQNQGCCATDLQLIGIDPENDFTIQSWLESELGRPLGKDECIVGFGIIGPVGTILKFYGHEYTVAGRLDPSGMGMDASIFIRMEDAYTMSEESGWKAVSPVGIREGQISAVLVRVEPGADKEAVAQKIRETVPSAYPFTVSHVATKVNSQLSLATEVLTAVTAAVTLVSIPFIALISTMVANERRRELALLRAMGATRLFIFSAVFSESLLLAALGGLAGIGISGLLLSLFEPLITGTLQVPFLWPSLWTIAGDAAVAIFLAVGIGGAASLYPAYRSSTMDPYEAIRRSEL
ncbi:MAG: ABC transporter permease [Methanomicrobiales archaeon]|nr:ABC transporter permease [Methanomicrobiales archaeon]